MHFIPFPYFQCRNFSYLFFFLAFFINSSWAYQILLSCPPVRIQKMGKYRNKDRNWNWKKKKLNCRSYKKIYNETKETNNSKEMINGFHAARCFKSPIVSWVWLSAWILWTVGCLVGCLTGYLLGLVTLQQTLCDAMRQMHFSGGKQYT